MLLIIDLKVGSHALPSVLGLVINSSPPNFMEGFCSVHLTPWNGDLLLDPKNFTPRNSSWCIHWTDLTLWACGSLFSSLVVMPWGCGSEVKLKVLGSCNSIANGEVFTPCNCHSRWNDTDSSPWIFILAVSSDDLTPLHSTGCFSSVGLASWDCDLEFDPIPFSLWNSDIGIH